MKIVSPIERIDRTFPGWDCVRAPCDRCKGRGNDNHGIHSEERHLVVRAELEDGRRVALSLTIVTGVYPATVPEHVVRSAHTMTDFEGRECAYYPRATDLSLHVQMPRGSAAGHACGWFGDEGRCFINYTTATGADEMFTPRTVDEALWKRLEARLVERLAETTIEGTGRHIAYIDPDLESLRRGGGVRIAACSCGWRGPERATLELAADDALLHEGSSMRVHQRRRATRFR